MLVAFLPVLHKSELTLKPTQDEISYCPPMVVCLSPSQIYICAFNYFSQGFVRFVMKIVLVDKMNQHQAGFGFNHPTHPK